MLRKAAVPKRICDRRRAQNAIGRSLASEIENKSIRLYINRVGVRKLIYLGKELSLLLFSIFIDILLVLTSIIN